MVCKIFTAVLMNTTLVPFTRQHSSDASVPKSFAPLLLVNDVCFHGNAKKVAVSMLGYKLGAFGCFFEMKPHFERYAVTTNEREQRKKIGFLFQVTHPPPRQPLLSSTSCDQLSRRSCRIGAFEKSCPAYTKRFFFVFFKLPPSKPLLKKRKKIATLSCRQTPKKSKKRFAFSLYGMV